MSFKPSPPERVALLETALEELPCEKRKMFGCPVYFANGALFAGVHEGRIFLRLSLADREALLLDYPDTLPFEPLPGRPMREYVVTPPGLDEGGAALVQWLACAHRYAASLPPKVGKVRRKGEG